MVSFTSELLKILLINNQLYDQPITLIAVHNTYCLFLERKSIRQSTAVKSAETLQRIKIRSELKKKKPKKVEEKMPTQEELLAEALITEKENLKSLGKLRFIKHINGNIRSTCNLDDEGLNSVWKHIHKY